MIISLNIYGEEVVMATINEDGKLLMLAHDSSKVVDFSRKNDSIVATINNEEREYKCSVDDNIADVERVYKKLDELGINYFDSHSQDMVVIVLE